MTWIANSPLKSSSLNIGEIIGYQGAIKRVEKLRDKNGACELCGQLKPLTFHHLIPRSCHSNKWFNKHYSKETMRLTGIDVCRPCHSFIHRQFSEKELGRNFNTLEKLKQEPVISKYLCWARKRH
ncbi:hypothetical protein [Aliikangiella sp. G2MR2-5]|uniref:hypothetical protein n=1 Tax=Aliikangiella sp. G2MR2-5 TaxID=2788943 RepID=UPI001AED8390|nr:hypothetical protein [Aliikangiella sp. G2MR2-5]